MKKVLLTLLLISSIAYPQTRSVYENLKLTIRYFDKTWGSQSYSDNPKSIDTSYYIIDQDCFLKSEEWKTGIALDIFTDFVEVDSFIVKQHWFIEVNAYKDNFRWISGIGIADQIIDYLIRRKLLSLNKFSSYVPSNSNKQ